MTARPTDWSPLGLGGDPVRGDADEVATEARHYTGVARTISQQVARLRRVADGDDSLKGDYSESLRDSCDDLAGDLQKAHGRFETVGKELTGLVDDLRTALSTTAAALDEAEKARTKMESATDAGYDPTPGLLQPSRAEPNAVESPEMAAARASYNAGSDELAAAKRKCERAVEAYDEVASAAASKIRKASDDDLKDGRFEGFKAWVKAHADVLREISKWLGRIVFVLAVAIVLLSNPAGWLVALALLSAVALLTVDTVLAVAGEGSWTDVALSAIGVLTLGAGSIVGKLARFGRSMTLFRAGNQAGLRAGMQTLRNAFNNPGLRGGLTNLGNLFRPGSYANAVRDGLRVARHVRNLPLVTAPITGRSIMFGRDAVSLADDLARIRVDFGPAVVNGLHATSVSALKGLGATGGAAAGVDALMDEGFPVFDALDDLTDSWTTREVSSL